MRAPLIVITAILCASGTAEGQSQTKALDSSLPVLAAPASASDWPQWRGDARDGSVPTTAVPESWPESLHRSWRVEIGEGYSSPIVVGDRAFTHSRRDPHEVVSAIDLEDGRVIWQQRYEAGYEKNSYATGMAKGPYSTPLLTAGRLFTLGATGVLIAWDAVRGHELWRNDYSDLVDTSKLFTGTSASPLIIGSHLVIQVGSDIHGGRILALDCASGETRWTWQGAGPGYASPFVAEVARTQQLIAMTESSVVGLDPADGSELWSTPFTDEWLENISTPIWTGSYLVVSGTRQGTHAYGLAETDRGWQATKIWTNTDIAMYMSTPILHEGLLYGLSAKRKGQFFAMDAATGEVKWASEGREAEQASILRAGKSLVVLTDAAELLVARLGSDSFDVERRYQVADSATWSTPVLLGGALVVRDASSLIKLTFD